MYFFFSVAKMGGKRLNNSEAHVEIEPRINIAEMFESLPICATCDIKGTTVTVGVGLCSYLIII